MALNFADVANKKMSDIEAPPLPPVGHYRWRISKLPEIVTTPNGEWDILNVFVTAVEAVDVEDIADYKGDIHKIMNKVSFLFNKNDEVEFTKTLNQVKRFFVKHVKCAEEEDPINKVINNSVGQEFLGQLAWKADKLDAELFHANITKTGPLD